MGWTSSYEWRTKKHVVEHVTSKSFWGENYTIMKQSLVGNHLWVLAKYHPTETDSKVFIGLFLLSYFKGDEGYGYKDISEDMGPCEVSCPKSFIIEAEKYGEGSNNYAKEWRKKVLAYHEAKKAKRKAVEKLAAGQVVRLYNKHYKLEQNAGKRRGWLAKEIDTGIVYRLTARQVNIATLVDATEAQAATT
jgi:hypothetical protein